MGGSSSLPCDCSRGVARVFRGGSSQSACTLRIVQITDVYVLDNFPSLRTLIKEKTLELRHKCGGQTISMLTGDFLAPYLLSSIDMGVGMMKMLNGTPIDYLTWGNHEDDIPHKEVMKREREYTGVWINTNMKTHESFADSTCQVEEEIIEVESLDGSNKRRIGLIGLLSNSPSLYRPGAFGGAKIEDPWEVMAIYKKKLEQKACDVVVPLCHLYEPQDEKTCRDFDFPVVLSGHDHHVVDRLVEGTRLLKPGQDGIKAVILDLSWPTASSNRTPVIEYEIVNVADWPPDEALKKVAEDSYKVLDPLRRTELTQVSASYRPLSSVQARGQRVSMGTFLLSRIRDAMNMDMPLGERYVDCALLKGGNIRGGREYKDDEHINLEVLQTEIEEAKQILVVPVPGSVLRVGLRETFGAPNPGWMQYDDEVELDDDGYVVSIGKQPLDPERVYKVATIVDFWRKRDAPSIGQYFEDHPEKLPEPDSGRPVHALLLNFFAMQLWTRIWKELGLNSGDESIEPEAFKALDADGDGVVSKEDLKNKLQQVSGFEHVFEGMDVLVDNMLGEIAKFGPSDQGGLSEEAIQAAAKHWSSRSLASLVSDEEEEVFTVDRISASLGQPLMTISPPTAAMLVLSVIFLNFGCINILVAVMVEHIVSIATETRESFSKVLAKVEKKVFAAMLEELTEYCDDGEGGGELTYKDFSKVIRTPSVLEKMKLLNFCFDEMELLFELMDVDGSGSVSPKEFVAGLKKMKGPALGSDVVRLIGLAQKQYWRALGFNRRLNVLNEKADIIQGRLNFLGKHCAEEMVERCNSEVRQENALKEAAQRQLVILEGDEKRRTTYPGLIPAEKKKPLRRAPWEEPDSDDDLPEVELFQESKEEGI